MINFIVYSPGEYSDVHGGVVVLHTLADVLAQLGENSYIYASSTYPENKAQLISPNVELTYDSENTIVIYPEVTVGNPLQSKYAVRWLLYTPGVNGGDGIYADTDLIFKFLDYFKAPDESKVNGILQVFKLKFDKFYNKNLSRSGECFIIKKGRYKVLNKHSSDSLNIDHFISDEYLAEVFNTKETFICYDPLCFHTQQAALCGCVPIIIPDEGISKEDFTKRAPVNKYGVAYGFEEIEYAKSTLHLVKPYLQTFEQEAISTVKNFINHCYQHMKIEKQ